MRRLALLILSLSLFAVPATASAADFIPAAGSYAVDTTTLKLTGPGTNITGTNQGGVAVFSFGTVNIVGGVTITAAGSRPFKLVASNNLTMAGSIISNGTSPNDGDLGPFAGGAGGGAGGAGGSTGAFKKGSGAGGGGAASSTSGGGGGGGFGGTGARGGIQPSAAGTTGGAKGPIYADLNTSPLSGGSGGSGSGFVGGGGGGGGIGLFGDLVTVSGFISVDGGSGALGAGASGGGSGGGVVLHGNTVDASGSFITARGGVGGFGGCCGDGGGGGGGRVAYQFRTLNGSGTASVPGGQSGVRQTSGCCARTPGNESPDPFGANGTFTKKQAATATTSPATAVSFNSATLNGSVNPRTDPTTVFFQYGKTTAYGSQTPRRSVGAGSAEVVVASGIGGLAPSTTYHFRVVAVDSLGFVTPGVDVGFTTAAAPPPPPPPPALTTVPSTTSINSLAFPKFTKLLGLSAKNLPANSKVVVTCKTKKKKQQKKGCPYKKKTFNSARAKSKLNLRKPYKKKKIPVGTKIGITITANGFLGKRITYTTRKGKLPKSKVQCLTASGKVGRCR